MDYLREDRRLSFLKDKFMWIWPNLCYQLVDLNVKYGCGDKRTLVIGSGRIPKVRGDQVVNTDIRVFRSVAVVTDSQKLSFADNKFDIVVCHQVLEHVPEADEAVFEIFRVLKSGGKAIITVPFYFPFHASPHDFRRWTIPGLRTTFKQFYEVESGIYMGPFSAVLTGIQQFTGLLIPNFYLSYIVKGLIGYMLYPFKFLDRLISRLPYAPNMAGSVYFVGKKK